jgi:exopolysaccharide biosynthesis polyprenyl glycosylphosphotransferase
MSTAELGVHERVWVRASVDEDAAAHARAEQLLPFLAGICLALGDLVVVLGAFLLAHWIRFVALSDHPSALGMDEYMREGGAVALATVAVFMLQGYYDEARAKGAFRRLHGVVSAVSVGLGFAMLVSIIEVGDQTFSRIWFAAGWSLAIAGLILWRWAADHLYEAARRAIAPANRVLIVGANQQGEEIAHELHGCFNVLGYVDNGSDLTTSSDLPLLGPIAQIDQLVQAYAINELIIALPSTRREQIFRIIARGFRRPVQVRFLPDLGDVLTERFEVDSLGGRRYIGFAPAARVSWIKRALDLVLTTVGLVALAPTLILIAVLIKLDSPGPVFYRQVRVGRHGLRFSMLKFRSMRQDAERQLVLLLANNEASGPLFKIRADPRVTRVGRVLRRLSLDELPQLFNVLHGEMSLVGPRPPLPSEVDKYEEWQFGRLRAVPGLTGLWQVSGRSDVPFHDMVRLDLHYIRNWSLGLDLEILLRTIPAVLTSRGAY